MSLSTLGTDSNILTRTTALSTAPTKALLCPQPRQPVRPEPAPGAERDTPRPALLISELRGRQRLQTVQTLGQKHDSGAGAPGIHVEVT